MSIIIWRFIFNIPTVLRHLFIHSFKRHCDGDWEYQAEHNDVLSWPFKNWGTAFIDKILRSPYAQIIISCQFQSWKGYLTWEKGVFINQVLLWFSLRLCENVELIEMHWVNSRYQLSRSTLNSVDRMWISFRNILLIQNFNWESENMCMDKYMSLVRKEWLMAFFYLVLNRYDFKIIF